MKQYPYTIENGSGESLTFLGVVSGKDGDRVEAESRALPGAGPPMHVHHFQEEAMTVVTGTLGFQVAGGPLQYAGPGDTKVFAPGVGHRWWNAGDAELRVTGWAKPPLNVEYFLSSLFDSMKRNGRSRPGMFDAAFLLTRYKSEFGMLAIPALVQKLAFPVLLAVGHALGKYERYRDAPAPAAKP
jgi:quercetin dioxygenase-like cupin family protein